MDLLADYDSNWEKRDIFVAQISEIGQWDWAISAGGNGDDYLNLSLSVLMTRQLLEFNFKEQQIWAHLLPRLQDIAI